MLKHILRSKIGKADSLSRRPDWEIRVEKDNENEMLVKLEWLEVRWTEVVEIIVDRVDLLEEVRESKVKDDKVVKAVNEMKWAGVKMLKDEEWREVDNIIYKKEKVYYNDWPHFIQVFTMMQLHGPLLCFISLHIFNGSVSTSLVGHVLYSADLMLWTSSGTTIIISHGLIMSG